MIGIFLIVITLVGIVAPIVILFVLPLWGGVRRLRREQRISALLLFLVPVATLASEAYPKWLVGRIAQEPLRDGSPRLALRSVYAPHVNAAAAARIAVQYRAVHVVESMADGGLSGGQQFEHLPVGVIRFQGRRKVRNAQECLKNEVAVRDVNPFPPHQATTQCTAWTTVRRASADYVLGSSVHHYRIGPFLVSERREFAFARRDKRRVNQLVTVSITGGIWWNLTEWLGDVTGVSSVNAGHTIDAYRASTTDYFNTERFLMTGQ